jgi:putative Ca2+/H+ antiporter (TMEM165/GDT1 family)
VSVGFREFFDSAFLAEVGDKTQIVTVALAARFHEFFGVVAGTTLGMMLANVPVIILGTGSPTACRPRLSIFSPQ